MRVRFRVRRLSRSVRQAVVASAAKLKIKEKIAKQISNEKFMREKIRGLHMGIPRYRTWPKQN
jgi:hypothetical protein